MNAPQTDEKVRAFVAFHVQRYHLSRSSILAVQEISAAFAHLKAGDSSAAEWAVSYLELRPYHFNSGYLKNDLCRFLRKVALSGDQKQRLRDFVVATVEREDRLDRKELSALARRLDDEAFRARLQSLAESQSPCALVAAHVLARCRMNDYRQDLRGAR